MSRNAPYTHPDGSDCWTKNCSRDRRIVLEVKKSFDQERVSRSMSYALRHHPEKFGLELDARGTVSLITFVKQLSKHIKSSVTVEDIREIVKQDSKGRYLIENNKIRAVQGHSVKVDLKLPAITPPPVLYHGTASNYVKSIRKSGLIKGSRQYVHLSADVNTATNVGSRHGYPVVLEIDTVAALKAGLKFYQADNGVWLTEHVPAEFITASKN